MDSFFSSPWLRLLGEASFWFPPPRSTNAGRVDDLFDLILWICVAFFALIAGGLIVLLVKYYSRPGLEPQESPSHSNLLEGVWTLIPTLIVFVIFFLGFTIYLDMRQAPDNAYEIQVNARKWSWAFTYPNGHVDSDLHVPVDRPVRLVMSAADVIHSLFIPAFRVKMDCVPGRYTTTWFEATEPGEYHLFCTEYCGTGHSTMNALTVVHPPGEFERWLADAGNFLEKMSPAEGGEILYKRRGCAQCHSIDGAAKVGPTFLNVFGTEQEMTDGQKIVVDENYLRESILEPQAKVRAGYKPVMPTYQGQLKDAELDALIAYIKSLSQETP